MRLRVGSAAVLLAALVAALIVGGVLLDVVLGVVCALALHEFAGLATAAGGRPAPVVLFPLGLFLVYRFRLAHDVPALEIAMGAAVVGGLLATLANPERATLRWAVAVGGALYIGLSLGYWLALLRWHGADQERFGLRLVGPVLAGSFACDIAALFCGRALGRHAFFPRISPRKTVEGAAAGALAATAVTSLGSAWLLGLSALEAVGLGLLVAVVAQGGDLVESALKRAAAAKDSGRLIPGHGGILDRLDSLLLLGPAVYCFVRLVALP